MFTKALSYTTPFNKDGCHIYSHDPEGRRDNEKTLAKSSGPSADAGSCTGHFLNLSGQVQPSRTLVCLLNTSSWPKLERVFTVLPELCSSSSLARFLFCSFLLLGHFIHFILFSWFSLVSLRAISCHCPFFFFIFFTYYLVYLIYPSMFFLLPLSLHLTFLLRPAQTLFSLFPSSSIHLCLPTIPSLSLISQAFSGSPSCRSWSHARR